MTEIILHRHDSCFFLSVYVKKHYGVYRDCNNNDRGQPICLPKNLMYVSQTDAERYGYESYAEAEKLNGRTAMLGFVAAVISYATSGSVFFFGVFGF